MKVTRRKKYDYLGMILNYHFEEKLKVDIVCYTDNVVEELLEELNGKEKVLQNDSLLKVNVKSSTLDTENTELFHRFIIKRIFLVKRARPNLKPSFAFLSA